MIWPVRIHHINMWMLALVLLTLSLSLAACSRDTTNQAAPVVQTTQAPLSQQSVSQSTPAQQPSSQPPAQTGTGSTTQLQNADQQIQKTLQSLDNAQNDVDTSSSVQENDPQP